MHRIFTACVLALSVGCATTEDDVDEQVASESTHCATSEPVVIPNNPTDGPNILIGPFAQTWRYFGSDQCRQPYDFNRALTKLGWPLTTARDTGSDLIQVFERVKMNAGGGCNYGACLSFSGIDDAVQSQGGITEGFTHDCNRPGLMRRPVECLSPELRGVYEANGGLEFYGFPISTERSCSWWNFGNAGSRPCVWTERAKLGRFPENSGVFRWQGEALGLKALFNGQVPGGVGLRGCDNFHVSNHVFNGFSGSFVVANQCGESATVSYNNHSISMQYAGPNGNASLQFSIDGARRVHLVGAQNPFAATLFVARLQQAEAAGRLNRGGLGGRCAASIVATLVGGLAFFIPPPVGPAVGGIVAGAGVGGIIGFCPNQ